jgi:hypothetical protein
MQISLLTKLRVTPKSSLILDKPLVAQPLKNFPTFYEKRTFITAFITVRHWSLSCARLIQSIPHFISFIFILILSSHLRLGALVVSFILTSPSKPCVLSLSPYSCYIPAHLIPLDLSFQSYLSKRTSNEVPHFAVFSFVVLCCVNNRSANF